MKDKKDEKIMYNGSHYLIADEIDDYVYTVNVNDEKDGIIFKRQKEKHLEIFKKVTGEELSDAMAKYFFKHDGLIKLVIRYDD